jgi:excisionase family DNA binding protein
MVAIAEREACQAEAAPIVRVQEVPAAATVDETAHVLRTSRNTVYSLLDSGELRSFTLGRKRLVVGDSIAALIRKREQPTYMPTCRVASAVPGAHAGV